MVISKIAAAILERDEVIRARSESLRRMAAAEGRQKELIHSEFFKPLNERLLALNKRLGL